MRSTMSRSFQPTVCVLTRESDFSSHLLNYYLAVKIEHQSLLHRVVAIFPIAFILGLFFITAQPLYKVQEWRWSVLVLGGLMTKLDEY